MELDLSKYPYRSVFTTVAKVIEPTQEDRFVAKASLAPLKGMVPGDLNPEETPDLLYFAADGAVAGLVNRNGDAIPCDLALKINSTAKNKFISVEHNRGECIGVALHTGYSKFGSNEPLTAEQATGLNEPFNMCVVGAIWKAVAPMIAKYLVKVGDAQDSDALSLSWEILVPAYDVGVGSSNLFDAKVIKASSPEFSVYDKMLRANGGSGKDRDGNPVFRIIRASDEGDEPFILGYSVVANPAAHVKGILPIVKEDTTLDDAKASAEIPAAKATVDPEPEVPGTIPVENPVSEKTAEKIITASNTSVKLNTIPTMKIETFDQLITNWGEVRQMESIASVINPLLDAMKQGSEDYLKQLEAKENMLKTAQQAQADTEKRAKEVEASLAEMQKQLDEVKAAAAATEANVRFNERMASLDEVFSLNDEERAMLASDVKDIADDDAWASYMAKCKMLMKEKMKAGKKPAEKDGEKPGDKKDDKEPDDDEDDKEMKAAVASIVPDNQAAAPANPVPFSTTDLKAAMAAAFEGSVQVK